MDDRGRLREEGSEDAHLSVETLAKWLAGSLEHDEVRRSVIPHLLSTCTVCRERYAEIVRLQEEVGHWDEEVAVFESRLAPEFWSRLAHRPFPEQLEELERDEEMHVWALCYLLLKKSREATFDNPNKAVELANLALRVVQHLGGEAYDPHWVTDLHARCLAHLGNALRVLGELRSAEDAFLQAESYLARSMTGNVEVRAEILDLKSSLQRARRQLGDALEMVDRALTLYREAGDSHSVGKLLLKKAKILEESDDSQSAIKLLEQASREIDPERDRRLFTYARYNLLGTLALAGAYEEASQLLPEVRDLFQEAQPLDLIRLRWAEGLIDLGLGRLGPAEAAFREVREEFLAREMGYDAALVSLDLARLFAQEGCVDDLKRLASELMPIFEARDVHREAIVTLLLFQRACEEERVTVDLVRKFAASLRRDRRGV